MPSAPFFHRVRWPDAISPRDRATRFSLTEGFHAARDLEVVPPDPQALTLPPPSRGPLRRWSSLAPAVPSGSSIISAPSWSQQSRFTRLNARGGAINRSLHWGKSSNFLRACNNTVTANCVVYFRRAVLMGIRDVAPPPAFLLTAT